MRRGVKKCVLSVQILHLISSLIDECMYATIFSCFFLILKNNFISVATENYFYSSLVQ